MSFFIGYGSDPNANAGVGQEVIVLPGPKKYGVSINSRQSHHDSVRTKAVRIAEKRIVGNKVDLLTC